MFPSVLLAVSSAYLFTSQALAHPPLPNNCLYSPNFGPKLKSANLGKRPSLITNRNRLDDPDVPPPPLEVTPLKVSGPAENRVDLVFFGDGYLESEKAKFQADALRLAEDISGNQTFNTVQPLMNFWAAFTPSEESGIGVGGVPKNTVYGLYRDGTELRGVYYERPEVAQAACESLGAGCDYAILLGNDPYYGGLGGGLTVITASRDNGPLVLRHELGHSIIDVGEEYDGGFVYTGVNSFDSLDQPAPWAHWMEPQSDPKHPERSNMPMQAYPWTLLNTSTSWSTTFVSSGTFNRHLIQFSLSGLPEAKDLKITLDGNVVDWTAKEDIGLDRWFYNIQKDTPLGPGEHNLTFTLLNAEREGTAQLCSTEILEYGTTEEFHLEHGYYGVYPTYSDENITTYRPTNDDCLMRAVTTTSFCKVCLEGLWLSLLKRVNLIDAVKASCDGQTKQLTLSLVPLAEFRETPVGDQIKESYTITWFNGTDIIPEYTNKTTLEIHESTDTTTHYKVKVQFSTSEIRVDKDGLTTDQWEVDVDNQCK